MKTVVSHESLILLFFVGLYQPVSQGHILPEISALGRIGVWRLLYGDFKSAKEEVVTQMSQQKWMTQPEEENFMLTELIIGLKKLNTYS